MNDNFRKDQGLVDKADKPVSPFEVLYDGPARNKRGDGDEGTAVPVKLSEEDRALLRALGDEHGDNDEGETVTWDDPSKDGDDEGDGDDSDK